MTPARMHGVWKTGFSNGSILARKFLQASTTRRVRPFFPFFFLSFPFLSSPLLSVPFRSVPFRSVPFLSFPFFSVVGLGQQGGEGEGFAVRRSGGDKVIRGLGPEINRAWGQSKSSNALMQCWVQWIDAPFASPSATSSQSVRMPEIATCSMPWHHSLFTNLSHWQSQDNWPQYGYGAKNSTTALTGVGWAPPNTWAQPHADGFWLRPKASDILMPKNSGHPGVLGLLLVLALRVEATLLRNLEELQECLLPLVAHCLDLNSAITTQQQHQ